MQATTTFRRVGLLACVLAGISAFSFFTAATIANAESNAVLPEQTPAVTSVTCAGLKKIEVVNSTDTLTTNLIIYTDVPGSRVDFVTAKQGCVLVTFSAPAVGQGVFIFVQVVLPSATCLPSTGLAPNLFAGQGDTDQQQVSFSASKTFICPDVAPGKHFVKAQWELNDSIAAQLYGFTMTVAHR